MRQVVFKELYMENFRCHKEMSFNFVPNRFCVITGPNGCISGETEIDIPRDMSGYTGGIKIKDLVGKQFHVYSINLETKRLELRKVLEVRKTGTKREVWKVEFEGDSRKGFKNYDHIIATPDHPFIKTDGEICKLKDLKIGDRLMSFYRRTYDGYCHIRTTVDNDQYEHKFICESLYGESEMAHHKDHNKFNNCPDNIKPMTYSNHSSYHAKFRHDNSPGEFMYNVHPKGMLGKKHTEESKMRIKNGVKYAYNNGTIDKKTISKKSKELWNKKLKGKKYIDRNWLYKKYWNEGLDAVEIAKVCRCSNTTIYNRMGHFDIPRRKESEVSNKNFNKYRTKYIESFKRRSEKQNRYKLYTNKEWLYSKYINEELSTDEIGDICSCSMETIRTWLHKFNIPVRYNHIVKNINFYGYEDTYNMEVDGNENFVANGIFVLNSGKTSILDALCWVIYDETTKGRKGDDVIRKRTGKDTMVKLSFSVDEDEYIIENYRKHSEYKDEKILRKNGTSITGVNRTETNKRLEDILMPKDVFMNCLLFSQYINKPFTEMTDTGQKNIFDRMMGFLKYNEYGENSKVLIKECVANINKKEETILLLTPSLERNKELLSEEYNTKEDILNGYTLSTQKIKNTINSLLLDNKKLKDIIVKGEGLKLERDKIYRASEKYSTKLSLIKEEMDNNIKTAREKLESDKNVELSNIMQSSNKELNSAKMELSKIDSDYNYIKQEITTKNEELKSKYLTKKEEIEKPVRKDLDTLQRRLSVVNTQLDENTNLIDKTYNTLHDINAEIENISSKLNSEIPICYVCKQDIKDSSLKEVEKMLDVNKKRKTECETDLNTLASKRTELKKHKDSYSIEIANLEKRLIQNLSTLEDWKNGELIKLKKYRDDKLDNINKNKTTVSLKIKEIEEKIKTQSSDITNKYFKKIQEKIDSMKDNFSFQIRELQDMICIANKECKIIENELLRVNECENKLEYNDGVIKSKKSELQNIKDSYDENVKNSENRISRLLNIIHEEETKKSKIKDEIDKLKRREIILEFWKTAFSSKGIRAILLDESIPILNSKSKELASKTDCIRVKFDSQKMLKSGEMRNQFTVLPIQTRNLTDNRSDFSQGEGRMVDIITLLSLRHLLEVTYDVKFNISLFDEILDSLYQDNAEIVIDFLQDISRECCTILITHTLRNNIDPDEHLEL